MTTSRFDRFTLAVSDAFTRRCALAALGLGAIPRVAGARKKHKHKHRNQKLAGNAFGCVSVGGKCRGKDAHCCSGVCQGKKPRKGEKDTSRCVAHDASICRGAADNSCGPGDTFCTDGFAKCYETTGEAGYCGRGVKCMPCTKDTDCVDACGASAACVICTGACLDSETMCVGLGACG